MRIPSYDDLTPSIPDITPRETFSQVTRFLPRAAAPATDRRAPDASPPSPQLFACLRAARAPEALLAIARDFSPRLERHGLSSLVVDVGGLGRLLGDADAIGAELARAAASHGLDLRIAVAPTQTAARLLTIGGSGLIVRSGDVAAALTALPLDTLRVLMNEEDDPRANAAARLKATASRLETFRRWGLATLGDVAALRLDLRLVDRTTHARVVSLPAAMRDAKVLRTLLLLDLESHPPTAGIDLVTVEIDPAPARIVQYSLLERAMPSPETLATLTARLGALVGESRIGSPVLLDTWRPDGFAMRRFDPASSESRSRNAMRESAEWRSERAPFARDGRVMLRRFRPPIAVRVTIERGRPVRVAIDRRGMPGGHVEQAAGPWRTSGAWWSPASTAWDRDEWDAALSDGSICRLFHDRISDRWFIDGLVD